MQDYVGSTAEAWCLANQEQKALIRHNPQNVQCRTLPLSPWRCVSGEVHEDTPSKLVLPVETHTRKTNNIKEA